MVKTNAVESLARARAGRTTIAEIVAPSRVRTSTWSSTM